LTHHQCINQFQSSCVTTVQESRDGRLQTTRDTPEGAQNPGINKTELSSPFNHKPHVTDQDFIEFNILSLIIFNYLTENAACFADRQNIYADRYRSADRRLRTTGLNHFPNEKALEKHEENCQNHDAIKIVLPEKGSILEFKNHKHSMRVPNCGLCRLWVIHKTDWLMSTGSWQKLHESFPKAWTVWILRSH